MATLTDQDKERIRYHTGYMETSFAASLQFGIPRPAQTVFLLEQAMTLLVEPNAVERVKCLLDTLDGVESQLQRATKSLGAAKVGNLELRGAKAGETHTDLLEREYVRWARRLADVLGVPLYPYSSRFRPGAGSQAGMIPRVR